MKKSTLTAIMYGVIIVLVIGIGVTAIKLATRPEIIPEEKESVSELPKPGEEITFFEENTEEVSRADIVTRVKVIDDNINVRQAPNTDAERFGSAYYGNTFEYISQSHDGWTKITYDNRTAYIYSAYVELVPMVMNVDGEYVEYLGAESPDPEEMIIWSDEGETQTEEGQGTGENTTAD